MKKKILVTMMTLGFISSVLAAPAGMINMDDPKMPPDSMRMPVDTMRRGTNSETIRRAPMQRMASDTDTMMPSPIMYRIDDPKMPADGERPMPSPCHAMPPMPSMMMGADIMPMPMMASGTRPGIASDTMPMMDKHMMVGGNMPNLGMGDGNRNGKAMHVRMLQAQLIAGGYMTGTTTGNFGALTRDAVKKYQKDLGIAKPTGYAGTTTMIKIKSKMKEDCMFLMDQRQMPMHDMDGGQGRRMPMDASGTMPVMASDTMHRMTPPVRMNNNNQ